MDVKGRIAVRGAPTGHAFVVVDGSGAKMIHTHLGANDRMSVGHLDAPGAARALASSSGVVVMDVPLPVALEAARRTRKRGSKVFYSPGVRSKEGAGVLRKVISYADFLVVDRAEISHLRPASEPLEAAIELQGSHQRTTVVATLGSSGSVVAREGAASVIPPFDLKSFGLKAVNSTGSGDAFLGAFACYSLLGSPPEEAARWGNLAGALKAASKETRGSPTRRELESRMADRSGATRRRRG